MSAAFSAMIVTIAPAFNDSRLRFTLIPATMIAIIMRHQRFYATSIAMPVVTVAPVTTVPVITVMIAIANL